MVTLSLDLYKKKELKSSRSVDDFACSGQGHAAQNGSASRLTTGADAHRSAAPAQPPPERPRPGPKGRNSAVFDDGCCN